MNALTENKLLTEMYYGNQFSYILSKNDLFLPTEYKVLQNQEDSYYVPCMKMLFNGNIQLYYMPGEKAPLSSTISRLDSKQLVCLLENLNTAINNVKKNGFLNCRNLVDSLDKIFVSADLQKIFLTYLPLREHWNENIAAFENSIHRQLMDLISKSGILSSNQVTALLSNLHSGAPVNKNVFTAPQEPVQPKPRMLMLVGMNTPQMVRILVDKPEFSIGKRVSNDYVLSFNQTISRFHCKIIQNNGGYWVTDLQSINGTYLNNNPARLEPGKYYQIKHGDILQLSDTMFRAIIE